MDVIVVVVVIIAYFSWLKKYQSTPNTITIKIMPQKNSVKDAQ